MEPLAIVQIGCGVWSIILAGYSIWVSRRDGWDQAIYLMVLAVWVLAISHI